MKYGNANKSSHQTKRREAVIGQVDERLSPDSGQRNLRPSLNAVTKLTDERKIQVAVVEKERDAFRKAATSKVLEILTAGQKIKLREMGKK